MEQWTPIGNVVGNTSTYEYTFVLRSHMSRVGDLVAVKMEVPSDDFAQRRAVLAWGRITAISRFNPFFPQEAAQELAEDNVALIDTVLSTSRDHLQADVLILGVTNVGDALANQLFPLTYPVRPAAEVYRPPASAVHALLSSGLENQTRLHIGTLLARSDVPVEISADRVVARHMAILAMTGGGKTVAARRILSELIAQRYPLLLLDPHGDYLGLWQAKERGVSLLRDTEVKLFFPQLVVAPSGRTIVETLIAKMTVGLTEPQKEMLNGLLEDEAVPEGGCTVLSYVERLIERAGSQMANPKGDKRKIPTLGAVRRSIILVRDRLAQMEKTNERMRERLRDHEFEQLPDPVGQPEDIVRPGQVSVVYLSGYDHLTQSTIVSLVMEALFSHRAELTGRIPPFLTLVEEAHNFIPSAREGTEDTPSLSTLRKVITEGRKFGTGLLLVTQRPSRVDETILAQCNSFLVLRLVNPKDQSFVRTVMENLSDSDARLLPGFGPGQGLVSGQAVRFPMLVRIDMDKELLSSALGDENFLQQVAEWTPDRQSITRKKGSDLAARLKKGKRVARG